MVNSSLVVLGLHPNRATKLIKAEGKIPSFYR
jgi:hypothetical protein